MKYSPKSVCCNHHHGSQGARCINYTDPFYLSHWCSTLTRGKRNGKDLQTGGNLVIYGQYSHRALTGSLPGRGREWDEHGLALRSWDVNNLSENDSKTSSRRIETLGCSVWRGISSTLDRSWHIGSQWRFVEWTKEAFNQHLAPSDVYDEYLGPAILLSRSHYTQRHDSSERKSRRDNPFTVYVTRQVLWWSHDRSVTWRQGLKWDR